MRMKKITQKEQLEDILGLNKGLFVRNKFGKKMIPFHQRCDMCDEVFFTTNPKAFYCSKCWQRGADEYYEGQDKYYEGQWEYKKEQKDLKSQKGISK